MYVLITLMLINAFNFIDRLLFGVVQEPLKMDLRLSDFQLGLLGGPAFAVLHSLAALPIARLAERKHRVNIVALCFVTWSFMTALCGLATSFIQMLLARIGVSIGESGCVPAAHSLLSDYIPPERRVTAMAIFSAGGAVGALVAAIGGGWIAQHYGWRTAFLSCGIAGISFAIFFRLTVREPKRTALDDHIPDLWASLRALFVKRSYIHTIAGGALAAFAGYGITQYLTSFFMRAHGLPLNQAALAVGIGVGGFGVIGGLIVGFTVDRLAPRFPRIEAQLPAVGLLAATIFYTGCFHAPTAWLSIVSLCVGSAALNFYFGPMYAIAQNVAAPRSRATATAALMFLVTLCGYSLGPPTLGLLSDWSAGLVLADQGLSLRDCFGPTAPTVCAVAQASGLRVGLTVSAFVFLLGGVQFWLASRTLVSDRHRVDESPVGRPPEAR